LLLSPPAGTHVTNTSEIGAFKVIAESGIASGVRRIEAVAGQSAVEYLQGLDAVVRQLTAAFKVKAEEVPGRVAALQEELRGAAKQVAELQAALAVAKSQVSVGCDPQSIHYRDPLQQQSPSSKAMAALVCWPPSLLAVQGQKYATVQKHGARNSPTTHFGVTINTPFPATSQALVSQAVAAPKGGQVLVAEVSGVDPKALQEAATSLLAALGDPAAVVLGCGAGDKVNFVAAVSPQVRRCGGKGAACTWGLQLVQECICANMCGGCWAASRVWCWHYFRKISGSECCVQQKGPPGATHSGMSVTACRHLCFAV
jgi:alanyl-tRNA synthetase